MLLANGSQWLNRNPNIKTEDALINAGLIKNRNIEKKKRMLSEKFKEECNNFQPKINKLKKVNKTGS